MNEGLDQRWQEGTGMEYGVQSGDRSAYCNSPHCIAALVRLGWRLSDPAQLSALVQELMTVPRDQSHEPSEHLHGTGGSA